MPTIRHPAAPCAQSITWLQSASSRGYSDLVSLLIARGANVSLQNGWGWAALHFAAAGNYTDIAMALRLAGADVRQRTFQQPPLTPLTIALSYGHGYLLEFLQTPFSPPSPPPYLMVAAPPDDEWFDMSTPEGRLINLTLERLTDPGAVMGGAATMR